MRVDKIFRFIPSSKIYLKEGKEYLYDPYRDKFVIATPEEKVRQKVLKYFRWRFGVPKRHFNVEVHMSKFGYTDNKERADILITRQIGSEDRILAVIECKAEYVPIDDSVVSQVLRYAKYLNSEYAFAINGIDLQCYNYSAKKKGYIAYNQLKTYRKMIQSFENALGQAKVKNTRATMNELNNLYYLRKNYDTYIGSMTPDEDVAIIANITVCLYDMSKKIKPQVFEYFTLLDDCGIRRKEFGNPGGIYNSKYRVLSIVDDCGRKCEVGFSIDHIYDEKTALNVAINQHHALQYVLDDKSILINGFEYTFVHSGKIAVGRGGSGKVSELKELIKNRYPNLIINTTIMLGTLVGNDRLYMDSKDFVSFLERIITYSLIRDEYRNLKSSESRKAVINTQN